MLLSPRKNGLTSLFKEVRAFKGSISWFITTNFYLMIYHQLRTPTPWNLLRFGLLSVISRKWRKGPPKPPNLVKPLFLGKCTEIGISQKGSPERYRFRFYPFSSFSSVLLRFLPFFPISSVFISVSIFSFLVVFFRSRFSPFFFFPFSSVFFSFRFLLFHFRKERGDTTLRIFSGYFSLLPCKARITLQGQNNPRDVNFMLVLKGILGGTPKITLQIGNNPWKVKK